MKLIKGYWKSNGKVPIGKETDRILYEHPPDGDYVAVYIENLIARIDIDDFSHKTGDPEDFIRGKPRSEAVLQYLNDYGYNFTAIKTENGVHIVMLLPKDYEITKNRLNWFCAMGIKIEVHVTNVFEPIVVNGIERSFLKGNLTDTRIDQITPALYPVQKGKDKPFLMEFNTGDRNNHISEYAFYLGNSGIRSEEIKEIIEAMNTYILDDPLPDSEIETILRPETMEKLSQIEDQRKNGSASPEVFKRFLQSLGMSIRYNELLNVVEYDNIPDKPEYQAVTDVQNVMPIKLMYDFRTFTGKQNITKHQVIDLILLEADAHTYNPVKDFLQSAVWDGKDRFPALFEILGVIDPFQQTLIRKWFYQTAGMPFNNMKNPFQAEGVLILQGAEGAGKTRFFQQLAFNPTWFSSLDKELTTKNKDILIQMLSVWIAEIGEVDRTFKANKSDVKSFITSMSDTIRRPYRMEQITKARTTSFCGTTNKGTFLNDDTGARRWWIIPVDKKIILGDFAKKENLIQFWSQCYQEYAKDDTCFRLTDQEMKRLKDLNRESMELLPAEEELRNRFDFDAPIDKWNWTTASVLKNIPSYDVSAYRPEQIGKAIMSIMQDDSRIKRKRTNSGQSYFIPPDIGQTDRFRNRS